jgi:TonB-dependent receptor-like protein
MLFARSRETNQLWPVFSALSCGVLFCSLVLSSAICGFAAEVGQRGNGGADGTQLATPAPNQPTTDPGSPGAASPDRTELNLLGETDAESGESRRNENNSVTLIDNNVLKELNRRLGVEATVITEFEVDRRYFGTEFGGNPSSGFHVRPTGATGFHGNAFWNHDNSAFSARSFFQVGKVKPAHGNEYGVDLGFKAWKGAWLSLNASQRKSRGQVNGNILVPTADERTPLTMDPDDRAMVEAIFRAYPVEAPNRTDINPRALNTNAPQDINNDMAGGVLNQALGPRDNLYLRYQLTLQNVEAFQLVGGQNPNTTTRNHAAAMTWLRTWSPTTTTELSLGFDRTSSLLVPDETSLGPFMIFSHDIEFLGPSGSMPIDRVQNRYRLGANASLIRGDHTFKFGGGFDRRQTNGFESSNHRGKFVFGHEFGRDTMTNLRWGTASNYSIGIGNVHRGFRDWEGQLYAGDVWRVTPRFTVNLGLRYQPVTRPSEVNNLSSVPYSSDMNNFAPRIGLAYRLPGYWGVLRAAYGLHYGAIFQATYMQSRFNPPSVINVTVRSPKLSDPLKDLDESDLDPTARSSISQFAPDLSTPYSHQYGLSWQVNLPRDWALELGYVGSRSHRLLTVWFLNRAEVVEGIPQISDTIDERRPDQRYFDVQHVLNGSRGYYDAGKVTLRVPRWANFTIDSSYWFSKAIDLGSDYTNTASGRDARIARGPSRFDGRKKGLSGFDQPHAWLTKINYEMPALAGRNRLLREIAGSWQLSSVVLLKSGTTFPVHTGSDSPGWGNVDGAGSDNPMLLDTSILGRTIDNPDTSVERLPAPAFGTIEPTEPHGNLGRNTFRNDAIANVNLAIFKRWMIASEKSLLFRIESLNSLNHPQFDTVGHDLSSIDAFGEITNTMNDGRAFQFALQFSF